MKLIWLALLVTTFALIAGAEPYKHTFDSEAGWVKIVGTVEREIKDGHFVVKNTGLPTAIYKHDADYSTFTYTVTLEARSAFSMAGIVFCWAAIGYEGYMFSISDQQQYSFGKWVSGEEGSSYERKILGYNSFISEGINELKVSKSGNTISFFCNDEFLESYTDSDGDVFESGSIGLVVGKGETIAFDQADVREEAVSGIPRSHFRDDFEDDKIKGWLSWDEAGAVEEQDGVLRVSKGQKDAQTVILSSGAYKNAPVKVVATYREGSRSGFYGIILMEIVVEVVGNSTTTVYNAFNYYINANASEGYNYAAFSSDASSYSPLSSSYVTGMTDTLEITEDFRFLVNGHELPGIDLHTTSGFNFNAVALFADTTVSVSFDDFEAGVGVPVRFLPGSLPAASDEPVYLLGGPGIIYNSLGQAIGKAPGSLLDGISPSAGNGHYFMVPKGNRQYPVRRTIIVR